MLISFLSRKLQKIAIKVSTYFSPKPPYFTSNVLQKITNKFLNDPLLFCLAPLSLPIFYLILLLPKHIRPKFGTLNVERLGHFGGDFMIRYSEVILHPNKQNIIHTLSKSKSCNSFLYVFAKRNLRCSYIARIYLTLAHAMPLTRSLHEPTPGSDYFDTHSRDLLGITQQTKNPIFTTEENNAAKRWLMSKGWTESKPIVCMLNRDPAYLKTLYEFSTAYHDYRNSPIHTYKHAAEWLIDYCDAFVIRMGKIAEERLSLDTKSFVDYPFIHDQSDFLDVWLWINCDFFISCGTGPDIMSSYSKNPGIYLNFTPMGHFPSYTPSLIVPKPLIWKSNGTKLTFREHLTLEYYITSDYESNDIETPSLNSEQVLASVKYGWRRFMLSKDQTAESYELMSIFQEVTRNSPVHKWIHPKLTLHYFK